MVSKHRGEIAVAFGQQGLAHHKFLPSTVWTVPVEAHSLIAKRLVFAVAHGVDVELAHVDVCFVHGHLDAVSSALERAGKWDIMRCGVGGGGRWRDFKVLDTESGRGAHLVFELAPLAASGAKLLKLLAG